MQSKVDSFRVTNQTWVNERWTTAFDTAVTALLTKDAYIGQHFENEIRKATIQKQKW